MLNKDHFQGDTTKPPKGVGRKISWGGGGLTEKRPKNTIIKLLPGGGSNGKRSKNSNIKPLISVPCMKIQGSHGTPCSYPAADAHDTTETNQHLAASNLYLSDWESVNRILFKKVLQL